MSRSNRTLLYVAVFVIAVCVSMLALKLMSVPYGELEIARVAGQTTRSVTVGPMTVTDTSTLSQSELTARLDKGVFVGLPLWAAQKPYTWRKWTVVNETATTTEVIIENDERKWRLMAVEGKIESITPIE